MTLEPNNVYLGDCLELMKDIPDKSVNCIICDLPFGVTACEWDKIIDFKKLWEHYERITNESSPIILFATQPFASLLVNSNLYLFKHELIWNKMFGGAFVLANKRILPSHENILLFYKKQPTYNPQKTDKDKSKIRPVNNGSSGSSAIPVSGGIAKSSKEYDNTKSFPTSILSFSSKMAECNPLNRVHPTQKPVALCEYLIKTYTNEGDIVLDNCAGSGSTLVAAKNLDRKYIGIEKEENYFNICKERLK